MWSRDCHAAAQRNLFNRMIGELHRGLQNGKFSDEGATFPAQHGSAT